MRIRIYSNIFNPYLFILQRFNDLLQAEKNALARGRADLLVVSVLQPAQHKAARQDAHHQSQLLLLHLPENCSKKIARKAELGPKAVSREDV